MVLACGSNPTIGDIVVRLEFEAEPPDSITVGESLVLRATPFNTSGEVIDGVEVSWSSSDSTVARIGATDGVLVGVSPGTARIEASAGGLTVGALVTVVPEFRLSLLLDTLLLVPGDTMSIPVLVQARQQPASDPMFGGGAAGVAEVDPTTGVVTATGVGTAPFSVRLDTVTIAGGIEVLEPADTTAAGFVYLTLNGVRPVRLPAGAFQHPTEGGGIALNFNSVRPDDSRQFAFLSPSAVTAPGSLNIQALTDSDLTQVGADPVCRPPGAWAVHVDRSGADELLLVSTSGTVNLTRVFDITGGRALAGRFEIQLRPFGEDPTTAGVATVRGTLVVPLVDLAACPG